MESVVMVKLSNSRMLKNCGGTVKVGYSKQLKMYILCVTITDWLVDYDRWYRISEAEFSNNALISELLKQVMYDYKHERFLFSWRKAENNAEQAELLHSIIGNNLD